MNIPDRPLPRRRARIIPSLSALLLMAPAAVVEGQDARSLTYTQESRLDLAGTLGAFAGAIPGINLASRGEHGFHIQGSRMRTDQDGVTTILDLEGGRMITIDHESQSYSTVELADVRETLEETTELLQELREELEEATAEARGEQAALRAEMEAAAKEVAASLLVQVRTERTGQTRSFGPVTGERFFLTTEVAPSGSLQAQMEAEGEAGGSFVFLMDLWQSQELADMERSLHESLTFDEEEARAWQALAAEMEDMAGIFSPMESLGDLTLLDPTLAAIALQVGDAVEAMGGTPVESRLYFVLVPEGVVFDRDLVLAWEPDTMGDVIQSRLTDEARDRAEQAARQAVRSLTRGFLGRGGGDDAEPEQDPVLRPMFRLTRELSDIRVEAGSPAAFEIPEGYQERSLGMGG